VRDSVKKAFAAALDATGASMEKSGQEVVAYAQTRSAHLVAAAGEPGFGEAVLAEAQAVALFAGIRAVAEGDAADARVRGLILGLLFGMAS
jgi:hypothetical protein